MDTESKKEPSIEEVTPNSIELFLSRNPDFFKTRQSLVKHLGLSFVPSSIIDFSHRRTDVLKEKNQLLETTMHQLVAFGENNDVILANLHDLAMSLMISRTKELVLEAIYHHLETTFLVPYIAMRVWGSLSDSFLSPETDEVSENVKTFFSTIRTPWCGKASTSEISEWFGENKMQLASLAVVKIMVSGEHVGLLAMGSEDENRFQEEMETVFLARMASLISAALERTTVHLDAKNFE